MKTLIKYLVIASATLGAPAITEVTGCSQALARYNLEQLDKHCEKYNLKGPSENDKQRNYNHVRYTLDLLVAATGAVFSIANCSKDKKY